MRVKELIEELSQYDEDAHVHFAYNYGDYWRTTVAPEVMDLDYGYVEWSDYHRMPAVISEDKLDEQEVEAREEGADFHMPEPVVILNIRRFS